METGTRKMRLSDCCPVAGISDGVIRARDGAVTVGWEVFLPDEHSVTAEGYERMLSTFAGAFRTLPDWTVVHRQDRYTWKEYAPDEGASFLGGCYERHFGGRRHLEHRHFIFFTINPSRPGRTGMFKPFGGTAAFGIRYRGVARRDTAAVIGEFISKVSDFMSVIGSEGMPSRRLGTADLEGEGCQGGLLQSWLQMGAGGPMLGDIHRDPSGSYVETQGRRLMAWSFSRADDLPGETDSSMRVDALSSDHGTVSLSWCSPLGVGLDCEHAVNGYFVRTPQAEVLSMLERRRKNMTAFSERSAENSVNAGDLEEFIEMIHRDSRTCVWTHANVMAWGPPGMEASIRGSVGTALARMGITAKMNTYDTPVLFWAAMPGGEMELSEDNWRLGELYEALCFSTWESYQRGLEGGFLKICDRHRHIPVPFDTLDAAYREKLIENYNAFVLGPSGSGKSFFTNWYVRSCYDRGGHIFIIDKGDSYETQCAVVREQTGGRDGVYYSWSAEHPFSFNPFAGWRRWDSEEDNDGMNFLLSVLRTIWTPKDGWNSVNSPILFQIVSDFLGTLSGREDDPVFEDFYRFLGREIVPRIDPSAVKRPRGGRSARAKAPEPYEVGHTVVTPENFNAADFDKALKAYGADGQFGFLLNDPHPADLFSSRFVVFEVDALSAQDPTLYSLCTFCILDSFQKKMRQNRTDFKLIFIDEAWAAIANPETAGYIRNLWKTARKYHTQAAVVTQQLSDILSSPVVQDAVLGNSSIRILLDQRSNSASFDSMAACFGLSERDAALVQSVGRDPDPRCRHEVFFSLGGRRSAVFSMEVSPQERLAYESDKAMKRPLLEEAARTGSIIGAIRSRTEGDGKDI